MSKNLNGLSTFAGLFIWSSLLTGSANAQDAPGEGLVYNTSEIHSMTYHCARTGQESLACNFEQVAVRPKATISDLVKAVEDARKEFRESKPPSKEECDRNKEMAAIFNGTKVAPKPEALNAMSLVEKRDMLQLVNGSIRYCAAPTEENYVEIVKGLQERQRRTCSVSVNTFKQTFRLVKDGSGQSSWVTQGQPDGVCGVVALSRFEPEVVTIGKARFTNWKYIARKVVGNPDGELAPGMKCSRLDEASYVYDWRSQEHQKTCDYIVFSPI